MRIALGSILLLILAATRAPAQLGPESTRFTVSGAPMLTAPRGEFRSNIGKSFGGIGGVRPPEGPGDPVPSHCGDFAEQVEQPVDVSSERLLAAQIGRAFLESHPPDMHVFIERLLGG